jgi:hypothetical protein
MANSSEMGEVRGEVSPAKNTQVPGNSSPVFHAETNPPGLVPSLKTVVTAGDSGSTSADASKPISSLFSGDIPGTKVTAVVRSQSVGPSQDLITILPQPERPREKNHVREIPENETQREADIEQWAGVVNAAESVFGHFASVEDVRLRLGQIESEINLSRSGILTADELTHLDTANIRKFYHSLSRVDSPIGREAKGYGMVTDSLTEQDIRDEIADGRKVIILDEHESGAHRPRHVEVFEEQVIDAFDGQELTLDPKRAYLSFIFEKRKTSQGSDGQVAEETVFEKRDQQEAEGSTIVNPGRHARPHVLEDELVNAGDEVEEHEYKESLDAVIKLRREINKRLRGCAIRAVESAFDVVATDEETDLRLDAMTTSMEAYNRSALNFYEASRLDLANISLFYHILTGNETPLGNAMSNHALTTTILDVPQLQQAISNGKKVIIAGWRGEDGVGHIRHLGMDEQGFIDIGENNRVVLNPEHQYFSFVFEERAADVRASVNGSDGQENSGQANQRNNEKPAIPASGSDDHGDGQPPGSEPPSDALSEGEDPRRVRDLINRVRRPFTITYDDAMRAGDLLRTFVNNVTQRELQTPDVPASDQFTGLTENAYTELAVFDLGDGIHARVEWQEGVISQIPGISRLVVYENIPGSQEENEICRYFSVADGPAKRVDLDQLHHPPTEPTGEVPDDEARWRKLDQEERNSGYVGVAEMADLENILARAPRAEVAIAVEILTEQETSEQEKPLDSIRRPVDAPEIDDFEAFEAGGDFRHMNTTLLDSSSKTVGTVSGSTLTRTLYLRHPDGTIALIKENIDSNTHSLENNVLFFKEQGLGEEKIGPEICDYWLGTHGLVQRLDHDTEAERLSKEMTGDIDESQRLENLSAEVAAGLTGKVIGLPEMRDIRGYLSQFEAVSYDEL